MRLPVLLLRPDASTLYFLENARTRIAMRMSRWKAKHTVKVGKGKFSFHCYEEILFALLNETDFLKLKTKGPLSYKVIFVYLFFIYFKYSCIKDYQF